MAETVGTNNDKEDSRRYTSDIHLIKGSSVQRQTLAGTSATPRTQRPATWCKDLSKPVHHEATKAKQDEDTVIEVGRP